MPWCLISPKKEMLQGLIFVDCGKSASSTISTIFRNAAEKIGAMHTPATFIRDHYPEEFKAYHKFAIMRNPYDRFVSFCLFHKDKFVGKNSEYFNKKIRLIRNYKRGVDNYEEYPGPIENLFCSEMITDEAGNIIVDQLIKYENLKQEIKALVEGFKVPHVNVDELDTIRLQKTSEKKHWRTYYDEELWGMVQRYYSKDIELWNNIK